MTDPIVRVAGDWKKEVDKTAFLNSIPRGQEGGAQLAVVQQAKIAQLSAQCQQAIFAGFTSSALGAPYHYPATDRDQSNLVASVLASILPGISQGWTTPFWCMDGNGAWAHLPHTAVQIQQVGLDGKAAIVACILHNAELAQQVRAATSIEQTQALVW